MHAHRSVSHQNTVTTFSEKYSMHTRTHAHTHTHTHTPYRAICPSIMFVYSYLPCTVLCLCTQPKTTSVNQCSTWVLKKKKVKVSPFLFSILSFVELKVKDRLLLVLPKKSIFTSAKSSIKKTCGIKDRKAVSPSCLGNR